MADYGTWSSYTLGCRCDKCKAAAAAYQRALREVNHARIVGGEAWHGTVGGYTNHKCRCDQCGSAFREYSRTWQAKNRERVNEKARERYARNPEKAIAFTRRWQLAHPDEMSANYARRKAKRRAAPTIPFTSEQLKGRWAYYGNLCYLCGDAASATDHVKPIAKGGAHMLSNLRPICQPCNSKKWAHWPYPPIQEAEAAAQ